MLILTCKGRNEKHLISRVHNIVQNYELLLVYIALALTLHQLHYSIYNISSITQQCSQHFLAYNTEFYKKANLGYTNCCTVLLSAVYSWFVKPEHFHVSCVVSLYTHLVHLKTMDAWRTKLRIEKDNIIDAQIRWYKHTDSAVWALHCNILAASTRI